MRDFYLKIEHLPPLDIHYEAPPSPTGKQWTNQGLLSNRSVNNYLAESDAFQRASFANIIEKWKEHEKNKVDQQISSFDSHYNMKIRFRHDEKLNRSSEMKYASGAKYYRFIGNENNQKHDKPCKRHKRQTQEYQEKYLREALKLPTIPKTRSVPYFLPKITNSTSTNTDYFNSPSVKSFVSVDRTSQKTSS